MEEVFLRVVGDDEAEAAIGDDLLDGSGGHGLTPLVSPNEGAAGARSVRRGRPRGASSRGVPSPNHTTAESTDLSDRVATASGGPRGGGAGAAPRGPRCSAASPPPGL